MLGNGFNNHVLASCLQSSKSTLNFPSYDCQSNGRQVKWLLVFASRVIPDFSLQEIHDEDFCLLPRRVRVFSLLIKIVHIAVS
jgi:hypothetical protein